jgi:NAD(P)H-quinone oxidoreductase subunit 4L
MFAGGRARGVIPIENFLLVSAALFAIGFYGVLARRSAILILIAVELMLAGVAINFVAFAAYLHPEAFSGLIFALFVITVAAAEVGLALGIILRLYRERRTANVDEAATLKW